MFENRCILPLACVITETQLNKMRRDNEDLNVTCGLANGVVLFNHVKV